ncbi:hypothetical protein C9374_010033 [Naegleria lovaniensis]|uniref:Sm protein B n=1 Tax=Naegleria lovaniensis TaxID=51637 RepID=A0AA88GI69_NAELO|nr:uncharacterized protein C9374_010033 [Naegleria lovaniensis]KAG2375029.1 hypothetical protein C9374_010033 [Naegleria lovaniensis]
MSMPKTSKLYQFLNYRMRITLQDGRQIVGKFMAFDKFMNMVLADCEEFRKIIPKNNNGEEVEQKRTLGFLLIRGENIISIIVEGPPPAEDSRVKSILTKQAQQQSATTTPRGVSGAATGGVAMAAARGMALGRGGVAVPQQQPMVAVGLMTGPTVSMTPTVGMTPMQPQGGIAQMSAGRGMAGGRGRGSTQK